MQMNHAQQSCIHSGKILHAKIVPLSIVSNVAMHEVQLTFKPNIFPVVNVAKVHDHL